MSATTDSHLLGVMVLLLAGKAGARAKRTGKLGDRGCSPGHFLIQQENKDCLVGRYTGPISIGSCRQRGLVNHMVTRAEHHPGQRVIQYSRQ